MYTIWKVGDKEYRLRLTTQATVLFEKQMKVGMTAVLDHVADVSVIVGLIWAAMQQYNHGISLQDVFTLYDTFIADGGTVADIIPIEQDLLAQMGYCEGRDTKNAESQKALPGSPTID